MRTTVLAIGASFTGTGMYVLNSGTLTNNGNIIFDARTKNRTPIAVVGLKDSILVQTDDATLVAHKSQAQKIKELVAKLASAKEYKNLV